MHKLSTRSTATVMNVFIIIMVCCLYGIHSAPVNKEEHDHQIDSLIENIDIWTTQVHEMEKQVQFVLLPPDDPDLLVKNTKAIDQVREKSEEYSAPVVSAMLLQEITLNGKHQHLFNNDTLVTLQSMMVKLNKCESKVRGKDVTEPDESTPFTFGDIIPTENDLQFLLDRCNEKLKNGVNSVRRKRQMLERDSTNLWWSDHPIQIMFTDDASKKPDLALMVQDIIDDYHRRTCLRFEMVEKAPNEPYILVVTELNAGCYSSLGKTPGAFNDGFDSKYKNKWASPIVLGALCLRLGIEHEQSRPDSGQFVDIFPGNIQKGKLHNFLECDDCETRETDYDYSSVMHYDWNKFSVDSSKPTVMPKWRDYASVIGSAVDMSFADWSRINALYCTGKCLFTLSCEDGYQNPNNCSECICANGVGQGSCSNAKPVDRFYHCGDHLTAKNLTQTLTMKLQGRNPKPSECIYIIQAPKGQFVEVTTHNLNFAADTTAPNAPCQYGNIEIRKEPFSKATPWLCGKPLNDRSFYSTTESLMFVYRWQYTSAWPDKYVQYRAVKKPLSKYQEECKKLNGIYVGASCYFSTESTHTWEECWSVLKNAGARPARFYTEQVLEAIQDVINPGSLAWTGLMRYPTDGHTVGWMNTESTMDKLNTLNLRPNVTGVEDSLSGRDNVVPQLYRKRSGGLAYVRSLFYDTIPLQCVGEIANEYKEFHAMGVNRKLTPHSADAILFNIMVHTQQGFYECASKCRIVDGCLAFNLTPFGSCQGLAIDTSAYPKMANMAYSSGTNIYQMVI